MNTTTSKLQKNQISLQFLLRLLFLLMIFSSLSISIPNMGIAAKVYRTAIDPLAQPFEVYDTSTDTWTSLGTVNTGAQLAVSADQKLYMYNRATDMIQVYNPGTNTWTDVLIGPGIKGGYGNLEVTNDGEFILTYGSFDSRVPDATQLYYTVDGTWYSFTLPEIFDFNFPQIPRNEASALADYDHATGTFVVGKGRSEAIWKINLSTFNVTIFSTGASFANEIRRFGEIYNDHWYSQREMFPITHYNLSDENLSIIRENETLPNAKQYSATVDHTCGIFYFNTFGTSKNAAFATWDPLSDTFTPLAPAPSAIPGGHTTIAFANQPTVSPAILWPRNHQMVDVVIQAGVNDNCGPVTLTASVSSSEPPDTDGDGNTIPDYTTPLIDEATGIITLQLRAERKGQGTGRAYTITVTTIDESGNSSDATVVVVAPHDRGKK